MEALFLSENGNDGEYVAAHQRRRASAFWPINNMLAAMYKGAHSGISARQRSRSAMKPQAILNGNVAKLVCAQSEMLRRLV